jgi:hypothetical protein
MPRKIVMLSVADLRPHPQNAALYGPPTSNSKYKDIKFRMQRDGFDERFPLHVTEDYRIIHGVTRWACARTCSIEQVPCEIFQPQDAATAELEFEREIVLGNMNRDKTQRIIAREQRKALELETALGRRRMAEGGDGGPSKATDRVGKLFNTSGKTIQRRIKILEAIESCEQGTPSERKRAERLVELLEGEKIIKALELISGKKVQPKTAPKVDVPRTLNDHISKLYSEGYEACCKAKIAAEVDMIEATCGRVMEAAQTARRRLEVGRD